MPVQTCSTSVDNLEELVSKWNLGLLHDGWIWILMVSSGKMF
jgi:hypothetical protein